MHKALVLQSLKGLADNLHLGLKFFAKKRNGDFYMFTKDYKKVFVCVLTLFVCLFSFQVHAATFIVTKTADTYSASGASDYGCSSSDCSLRQAIYAANNTAGLDVIWLPEGDYSLTLTGSGTDDISFGDLDIEDDVYIFGDRANNTIIEADSGLGDRVFEFASGHVVWLRDLTVTGGSTTSVGGGIYNDGSDVYVERCAVSGNTATSGGGGIYNSDGTFTIYRSAVNENTSIIGGGIYNDSSDVGLLTIVSSTISSNTATSLGGGIYNYSGMVKVSYSTVAFNTTTSDDSGASELGAGAYSESGDFTFKASILSNNTQGDDTNDDCYGEFESDGFNLVMSDAGCTFNKVTNTSSIWDFVNDDPTIDPLADNGGPTDTHAIAYPDRPYNCAEGEDCSDIDLDYIYVDQRGAPRPYSSRCDFGSFEYCEDDFLPSGVDTRYFLKSADTDSNVGSYSGGHSIYMPQFFGTSDTVKMTFDSTSYFDISEGDGSGATGRLHGTAKIYSPSSSSHYDEVWTVEVEFEEYTGSVASGCPKKELSSSVDVQTSDVTDEWRYFTMTAGTLTLSTDDTVYADITEKGCPFQIGYSASGKNMRFGGSAWFDFTHYAADGSTYVSTSLGSHGDFNLDLIKTECPEPEEEEVDECEEDNLVLNGSFEEVDDRIGTINGIALNALTTWDVYESLPDGSGGTSWYVDGTAGIELQYTGLVVDAQDGDYYAELDSHGEDSNVLSVQSIELDGGDYELSFYYRPRTSTEGDNTVEVYFVMPSSSIQPTAQILQSGS